MRWMPRRSWKKQNAWYRLPRRECRRANSVAEDSLSMAGARGTGYRLSVALRARRAFLRWLFRIIFHILCRIRVEGKENIPKKGSYLIAFNHISLFEPPLVLCFWPSAPEAIAGADVFERPWQKILVK